MLPVIAGLTLLACSFGLSPLVSRSTQPAGTEAVPAPPTPAGEGPFNIRPESVGEGLSSLNSYRARVSLVFTGTRGGEPAAGSIESLAEVTQEPPALHQYLKIEAVISQTDILPGVSELFQAGDKTYVKRGSTGPWFTFTSGQVTPDQLGFFEPEKLIILPKTVANPPRFANLNGRNIQQYTFDENDLADPNLIFEQADGELWLTTIGNYVVRYVISASLKIIIPNPAAHIFDEGQLSLSYTLSDVNASFTITPPRAALTATNSLSGLPRLPDAEIVSVFPGFIEYTSAITPVAAVFFYRDELAESEWMEESISVFNEKARLVYSREGQTMTILINPAGNPDKIKVSIKVDG